MSVESGRVVPVGELERTIEQVMQDAEGGGFPFVWVTVGVAAAGVAALLLGSDPPDTGSLVIQFPNE